MSVDAYPLAWPASWPRTEQREPALFRVTAAQARSKLAQELRMLGATDIVISSNLELRRDGLPKAKSLQRSPDDPGVAVYFELDGKPRCIPCDRWTTVYDNMRAIGLTVAALRGLDRWGARHMVDAAFSGFDALPAGDTSGEAWWDVLGVTKDAPWADVRSAYLAAAKRTHPDVGGDPANFARISAAYEQASEVIRA